MKSAPVPVVHTASPNQDLAYHAHIKSYLRTPPVMHTASPATAPCQAFSICVCDCSKCSLPFSSTHSIPS